MDSPVNNALITGYLPRLDWYEAVSADHYHVQISTSSAFSLLLVNQNDLLVSGYPLTSPLTPNTTYYWRVRAINSIGQASVWSSAWSFRTAILPPTLNAPANAELLGNKRPTFTWNSVSGAASYTLEVSISSTFTSKAINITAVATSYTPTTDLTANKLYYWRVKANGTNGPSLYSQVRTFTTGNPPSVPALTAPATNTLITNYTPLLDWTNITLPAGTTFASYQVQVAADAAFSSPVVDDSSLTSITASQFTTPELTPNTKYY
jgi:trimeric autotransporter adhesin